MTFDQDVIESNFNTLTGERAFDTVAFCVTAEGPGMIEHAFAAIVALVNRCSVRSVLRNGWERGEE